ncbi:dual oxidase-like isoform X2 [Paramacrobiotus metropolitanus]|uniref:dual oxidase-like isoform X2 n=1 Tax=Paramacrobiotus metropolitanus TaxID=2943436 RepID=UPI002445AFEC|nr:dual oxidase-like isoform X2 [Paramacrobiotus metropolitanus]
MLISARSLAGLIWVFIAICYETLSASGSRGPVEVQRYDGWYNNLAHPDWGSVDSHIIRKAPTSYTDGVYMLAASAEQPSPRLLSQRFMKGRDGLPSVRNRTTMLAFFGEFLAFDILQGTENSCPIEMLKIPIEPCDGSFDPECQGARAMPILRTKYDQRTGHSPNSPRAQLNGVSSWLDGSAVYSTKDIWVQHLREFRGGRLKVDATSNLPPLNTMGAPIANPAPSRFDYYLDPSRLYMLGDARSNQHPPILAITILFYRFHNVMAEKIQHEHPDWMDEDVFQQARRLVIAVIQNIALYEYLPALLDTATDAYRGYQPDIHPGISDVFQAAAFRFGHTQIPAGLYIRDEQCNFQRTDEGYPAFRLCNIWFDSQSMVQEVGGIEPILMGLVSQIGEREDAIIIDDLREHIFGPLEFSRRDLAAVNIMRGRDYGLPDYNSARKAFKLTALANWSDINQQLFTTEPELLTLLRDMYKDRLDDVDLYVGGMLECDGSKPGELFSQIIREQFYRLRDADRFWFENIENGLFTGDELQLIKQTTLHDVIVAASSISPSAIQRDVFFWRDGDPCPQPAQIRGEMLEPCVALGQTHKDVFAGNEVAYIYTCVLIFLIAILSMLAGYLLVKYRGRTRRKYLKRQQDVSAAQLLHTASETSSSTTATSSISNPSLFDHFQEKIVAVEWLHHFARRPVKVKFGSLHLLNSHNVSAFPEGRIHVESRKGDRLRSVALSDMSALLMEVTENAAEEPMAMLHVHKEPDLVLIFESTDERRRFVNTVREYLKVCGKELVVTPTTAERIVATAETKEKRQRRLDHFFKIAYERAFGLDEVERSEAELKECHEALELKLSKVDFAEALAMKPNTTFIQKMFNCIDKAGEGRISFQQFLDLIVRFAKGDFKARLRVVFDMCDVDENDLIKREELLDLLRSLLDIAASQILEQYGLAHKSKLSFQDFLTLFTEDAEVMDHLSKVGLDFKGVRQTFLAGNRQNHNKDTMGAKKERLASNASGAHISATDTMAFIKSPEKPAERSRSSTQERINQLLTYMEEHKQHIFYLCVFYVIIAGVWLERFSYYMFLNETNDLRRVMGAGIAITRGSAAAISVAFPVLLLTVSRNIITRLRETFLHHYIPFDSLMSFHKIAAWTGFFFAVVHTVGHLINFYHVSTQPIAHLKCLFKEVSFGSTPPPFTYWVYQSLTGLTGILLVITVCVMFVFALPAVREHAFHYFWIVHRGGYIIFYILCILHGLPRLTGDARFPLFLLVPLVVFVIDRLMSIKQTVQNLQVVEAELLPSDVIHLTFERPSHFTFRSGQWIRLACTAFRNEEAHPFTLTSMPHEPLLSVHVKAHGIWTWKLRQAFDPVNCELHNDVHAHPNDSQLKQRCSHEYQPRLRIEGPFGGGNQDWYKFEVAVMVGAGMGVTPYASILKDLVFGTSTNRYSGISCRKVYFLWICPSHKPFEWFVDALHEIEKRDVTRVLEMHIFVTQFFDKFDLRTTILYICEKHFQRLSRRSLFTGLKASNHFGRPDVPAFLAYVQRRHANISSVGVFSCGPKQMTESIGQACEMVNRRREYPRFVHHFENF